MKRALLSLSLLCDPALRRLRRRERERPQLQLRRRRIRRHQHRCRRFRRLGPERLGGVHAELVGVRRYSNQKIKNTDVDFDQWRLGVGYNHQLGNGGTDLVTRAAYEKFDAGAGANFDGLQRRGRRAQRADPEPGRLCAGRLRGWRCLQWRFLRPPRRAGEVQPELGHQRRREDRQRRRHPSGSSARASAGKRATRHPRRTPLSPDVAIRTPARKGRGFFRA